MLGVKEKVRSKIPLYGYENKSFYIIRNDALDRFGTPLEQRFTKKQIQDMMERCGLSDIVFSNNIPYWHVVGKHKQRRTRECETCHKYDADSQQWSTMFFVKTCLSYKQSFEKILT